jgi:hypothetical protein
LRDFNILKTIKSHTCTHEDICKTKSSKKLLRYILIGLGLLNFNESILANDDFKIEFLENFGGLNDDYAIEVVQTYDRGFVTVGYSNSSSAYFNNQGGYDGIIIKYSQDGNILWADSFGGSGNDYFFSVTETSDNGLVAVGYTFSDLNCKIKTELYSHTS